MTVLVLAEHDNASLKRATLSVIAAARKVGGEIHVLVAGQGARAAPQFRTRRVEEALQAVRRGLAEHVNMDLVRRQLQRGAARGIRYADRHA